MTQRRKPEVRLTKMIQMFKVWPMFYLVTVSSQSSASPVISQVSNTVTFSWQIPQGGLTAGSSFLALSPDDVTMFILTSIGTFFPTDNYRDRVTFLGSRSSRNITFTMTNIQTSDAGNYSCRNGGATDVIPDCGQMLIVLGKPTTPSRPVASSTPVYNQQVILTSSSSSTTVPADHGLTMIYSWQKDRSDVSPFPGSSYTFTVKSRDNQTYRCRARESQGLESEWSPVYNMVPEYSPYQISLNPSTLSYTVTENQDTISPITCSANCRPGCNYRWFKNATTTAGTDATLRLGPAVRAKTGSYRCQPNNTHGDDYSSTVGVNVWYAPTIDIPSNKNVTENTRPNIDCSSNITPGNPSSTSYRWTGPGGYNKTGAVLNRNFNRTQGGQYNCSATNTEGLSDIVTVNINVQYAPVITSVPSNKDVTENTSPNINCSSNITPGNPSSTSYNWTGPGGYSKTGAILDRTVTRTQGGQYTCTATSTAGLSDTAHVNINVQYTPTITSVQSNKNVTENTSPNIDCSSDITPGNPSPTSYRWTGPGGYNKTGAVLDRNVTRTQRGQYTCTATNTAGLSDTATVNVSVQYGPGNSVVVTPVSPHTVTEGSGSLTINCSADCRPDCGVTFTKDGYDVGQGRVTLTKFNRTDAGNYTCKAVNDIGHANRTFVLVVQYLDFPSLTISSAQVMENSTVQVLCKVASNPTVHMTIRNVDNNTNLVEQEVINSRQYDIERVQCLHNGTYQCVADNRQISRTENASASLNVLCSPRHDFRKNSIRTVASEIDETAIMVADVIANPLPNFTWWRYDGNQLVPFRNSTIHSVTSKDLQSVLQINVSSSRDYGEYAVQVENSEDTTLLEFELTAKSPPFTPTTFDVLVAGAKSATLQWTSNFNGGAEQTFYLEYQSPASQWKNYSSDGIKDPGRDNVIIMNITQGLEPNTEYFFKLYSHNIYGRSDTVTTTITTAKEPVVPASPVSIAAIAGGIGAALLVIIIVAVVILLYKRGVCGAKEKKTKDVALFERGHADEEKPEMCDNVLYATSAETSREKAVMEDNVLYAGSGDVNGGGASAAAASGGDVYAVVQKKKPVTDIYTEVKPKKGKAAEKKKDKKKGKKADDQKPLKNKRSRGDVYENTVPGQFQEGNTYANAGFEWDEDTNKEQAPAYGRDEDGLLYVGIDFSNQKPSQEVHGAEDATEYAGIAFGKVGPPLPPDEEEKDKEKE